jgi:hypothetical protein
MTDQRRGRLQVADAKEILKGGGGGQLFEEILVLLQLLPEGDQILGR